MAEDGKEKAGGGRRVGCFGLLTLSLFILAVLAAIAATVYLHSEDGRRAVEVRAEKWFGLDMTVHAVSLGWPGCLVLGDLESDAPAPDSQPLFRAREVRVGVGRGLRWRMELYRPALTLARSGDGSWAPGCFGRVGELPNMKLAELGPLTEDLRARVDIEVEEGSVRWLDEAGKETAAATGVDLRIRQVNIPDRKMYHYVLIMHAVLRRDGARVYDVQREWLSSVDPEYVELHSSANDSLPEQEIW